MASWVDWQRVVAPHNTTEIQAVETDRGNYLGYVRLVVHRRAEAMLDEPIESVPTEYAKSHCCVTRDEESKMQLMTARYPDYASRRFTDPR
jgi:hypothetical protein